MGIFKAKWKQSLKSIQVVYEKLFLLVSVSLLGRHYSKVGNMSEMIYSVFLFHNSNFFMNALTLLFSVRVLFDDLAFIYSDYIFFFQKMSTN